jgi:hypothetical protein
MIIDHTAPLSTLQPRYVALRQFFASQHTFGYAVAQENHRLARPSHLRIMARSDT